MKLVFQIYAHEEDDEGAVEFANDICEQNGFSSSEVRKAIEEFLGTNPLYEIEFDIALDTMTGTFEFLACHSTQGDPHGNWELINSSAV